MESLGTPRKTISLWSHIAANRDVFLNPFYIKSDSRKILEVSAAQKNMRFWKEHFLQYIEEFSDVYDIYGRLEV